MQILVLNFDKDVTTNFIKVSGEPFTSGDNYENDDFE